VVAVAKTIWFFFRYCWTCFNFVYSWKFIPVWHCRINATTKPLYSAQNRWEILFLNIIEICCIYRHDSYVLYILLIIVCITHFFLYELLFIRVGITNYYCMYYLFDFVLSLPSKKPEILNENLKFVITG